MAAIFGELMWWTIKSDNLACLKKFTPENCDEVTLALDGLTAESIIDWAADAVFSREQIRLALPLIVRASAGETEALAEKVRYLQAAGFARWEISQLGQIALLTAIAGDKPVDITADWPLYTLNTGAAAFLAAQGISRLTASPEDERENLRPLLSALGARLQVIMYQDTPLFTGEACPKSALQSGTSACACDKKPFRLTNSRRQEFMGFSRRCRTTVVSRGAYSLAAFLDELTAMGLQNARIDFVNREYTADEAWIIWEQIRAGRMIPGTHNGNYLRGLQ